MPQLMTRCQRVAVLVPLLCAYVHCQWTTVHTNATTNVTDTTASTTTTTTTTAATTTAALITSTTKPTTVITTTATEYLTTAVASGTSSKANEWVPIAIVIPIVVVVIIVAVIIIVVVVRRRRCHKHRSPGRIPRPDSMDPFSTEQNSSSTAHLEQHAETINGGTVSAVRPAISNGNTHQLQNTSAPHVAVPVPTGELTADDELYLNSDQINNNQLPVVRTVSLQSMMPPAGQTQPTAYRDPLAPDTGPRLAEPPKLGCGPVMSHGYVNVQNGAQPQPSQQDAGEDKPEYMNYNELENVDPVLKGYVNIGPILEHMKASRNETANQAEV